MKTYLLVWMAFWIYFEYKTVTAWRWRKYGCERMVVAGSLLKLSTGIPGRYNTRTYDREKMGKLRLYKANETSIVAAMNSAYWNRGNPCIAFDYGGEVVHFGAELSDDEARQVMAYIARALKKAH